jgi:hypothetical protein
MSRYIDDQIRKGELTEFGDASCGSKENAEKARQDAILKSAPTQMWPFIVEWVKPPRLMKVKPAGWGWYGVGRKIERD